TLTHSLTYLLTYLLTQSLTHSLPHSHSLSLTYTHILSYSLTYSLTHSLTHLLTYSLTNTHIQEQTHLSTSSIMAPLINRVVTTLRRSRRIWQRNERPAGAILLRLPPEIREMIYAILFSGGHLDIIRVSRMINAEAQLVFYQAAIARQSAGFNHKSINRSYNRGPTLQIQNFELQCNMDSRLEPPPGVMMSNVEPTMQTSRARHSSMSFRCASRFGEHDVCRTQMVIKLDFGPPSSLAPPADAEKWVRELLQPARIFRGFKVLVIEATRTPSFWTMADKTSIGLLVNSVLEPELGPASGDDIGRIEYRPWSVVASQRHTIESLSWLSDSLLRLIPHKRFEIDSEREAEEIWADHE
ncbi:hypothetical protein BDR22DRAFT_906431, partial [Usnea florida]